MFDEIRPYNDEETKAATGRISSSEMIKPISEFLYPGRDVSVLREQLKSVKSVDDFQDKVMSQVIDSVVARTTDGLTFSGLEYFKEPSTGKIRHFLLLSNHRDIVLDSAFIQIIFFHNHLPLSEIAVGDNLMMNSFVEDIIRSNRMIKVIRSENPREVYLSSKVLSDYIRRRISALSTETDEPNGLHSDSCGASVWIAHRNGRTKDGYDLTEQGVLKMLDMSGKSGFIENFEEMEIMPVSVSYEFEPCDLLKAEELWVRRDKGAYKKRENEDLVSIMQGIMQQKGRVHIEFCKPVTTEELTDAASHDKNERFRRLAEIVDERIVAAYRLWPNNFIASAMLTGKKSKEYTAEEEKRFVEHIDGELKNVPSEMKDIVPALKEILLEIYAAPVRRVFNI